MKFTHVLTRSCMAFLALLTLAAPLWSQITITNTDVARTGSGNVFSGNQILNGSNNTAPNHVGSTPGSSTLLVRDQARRDEASEGYFLLRDDFGVGGTTSGTIGELGWQVSGTIPVYAGTGRTLTGAHTFRPPDPITGALATTTLYLGGNSSDLNQGFISKNLFSNGEVRMTFIIGASHGSVQAVAVGVGFKSGTVFPRQLTPEGAIGVKYVPPAPGAWSASTAYAYGDSVRPTSANGCKYICTGTAGGTSGGSQPTWPTAYNATVSDGSVTWTCAGADGAANFVYFVSGTSPMTEVVTATSSVAPALSTSYKATIRINSGIAYFAINGGAETPLSIGTYPQANTQLAPFFMTRRDTMAASDPLWTADFFSLSVPVTR